MIGEDSKPLREDLETAEETGDCFRLPPRPWKLNRLPGTCQPFDDYAACLAPLAGRAEKAVSCDACSLLRSASISVAIAHASSQISALIVTRPMISTISHLASSARSRPVAEAYSVDLRGMSAAGCCLLSRLTGLVGRLIRCTGCFLRAGIHQLHAYEEQRQHRHEARDDSPVTPRHLHLTHVERIAKPLMPYAMRLLTPSFCKPARALRPSVRRVLPHEASGA